MKQQRLIFAALKEDFWKLFYQRILLSITVLPLIMWLLPGVVPFGFFEFWKTTGTPLGWLCAGWPLFVWGGATISGSIAILTKNDRMSNLFAERVLGEGAKTSLIAGVLEEITFRWLFVMWFIVIMRVVDYVLLGFMGYGVLELFYNYITGPVMNFLTFGVLSPQLFHPAGWFVGSAILASNFFFKDGHKYQGTFGTVNSWFGGVFLFWILFHYGLPAAIMVHFLYDIMFDLIHYVDSIIERKETRQKDIIIARAIDRSRR